MGTGKNPGQHKGGKGEHMKKLTPGYPRTTEGVARTVESPKYPRSNFKSGKSR